MLIFYMKITLVKKIFRLKKKCWKNVSFSPLTIDLKVEEYQIQSKIKSNRHKRPRLGQCIFA